MWKGIGILVRKKYKGTIRGADRSQGEGKQRERKRNGEPNGKKKKVKKNGDTRWGLEEGV